MHVVQHPQRVKTLLAGHAALLPVQPPEIGAQGFEPMVQVEVRFHESRTGQIELDRLAARRVNAHVFGDFGIAVFKCSNAVARVDVERRAQSMLVQNALESLGVGEEFTVPRVAGPSGSILRVDIVDQMPVHVDDGRGERQAFLLEAIDKLQILGFRVPVVAAPPVAEREARQQRRRAGELVEVLHGFDVPMAVSEDIQILAGVLARNDPHTEWVGLALDGGGFGAFDDHV